MNIKFEKVERVKNYDFNLPSRKTKGAAGYDFEIIKDVIINAGETKLVKTGVKAKMPEDMVLMLFIRSSLGIKANIELANGTGIIDSDYYNSKDNEGEIAFAIRNNNSNKIKLNAGERIGQGIFVKYFTTDDDACHEVRTGGFGSTGK